MLEPTKSPNMKGVAWSRRMQCCQVTTFPRLIGQRLPGGRAALVFRDYIKCHGRKILPETKKDYGILIGRKQNSSIELTLQMSKQENGS